MRKSREEALETRKRIVSTAAAEIRKNGIVASGLNELMAAAGLTRGGFYKHFESKNQLIAEACSEAMNALLVRLATTAAKGMNPSTGYLDSHHRDHPESGCPLSAIGAELARCDDATRSVATKGFSELVELLAKHFGAEAKPESRQRAIVAVSTMIGALTMARAVNDQKLSAEILREAKQSLSGPTP